MSTITPTFEYEISNWGKPHKSNALVTVAIFAGLSVSQLNPETIISKTASQVNSRALEITKSNLLEILRQSPTFGGFQTVDDPSKLLEFARQYLRESKWGRPCDAMFEYLTDKEPMVLLNLIRSGSLEPGFLSTAAEFAGQIDDPAQVIPLLQNLTLHAYPMVREGAVYGLASFIFVKEVRQHLKTMSETDSSPGVRSAAQEMLED
jgi:hypothetical protein